MSLSPPPSPFIALDDGTRPESYRPTPRVAFIAPQTQAPSSSAKQGYDFARLKTYAGITKGTLIRTPEFDVPVEKLRINDIVMTVDNGPQPIRWINKISLAADGPYAPVVINDRALGNVGTLIVAPDFRVVLKGWRSAKVAGAKEVFAAAQHLVNDRDIKRHYRPRVTYYHLAFDKHEVIEANGVATESLHPEVTPYQTLPEEIRNELRGLYPDAAEQPNSFGPLARPEVKPYEARLIRP